MLSSRMSTRALASARLSLGAASATPFAYLRPARFTATEADAKKEGEAKKAETEAPKGADPKVAELEAKLKKKDEEIAELKKNVLYTAAEAENARRIAREDVAKAKDFSVTSFAKDMVEVADTLEKAVEAFEKVPPEEQKTIQEHKILASILQGVKMSTSVLQQNFARHGVEKLKVKVGDEFDPNKHNALFNSPATDAVKPGQVSTIIKSGYMLKERVLRATAVGVAQKQE